MLDPSRMVDPEQVPEFIIDHWVCFRRKGRPVHTQTSLTAARTSWQKLWRQTLSCQTPHLGLGQILRLISGLIAIMEVQT